MDAFNVTLVVTCELR